MKKHNVNKKRGFILTYVVCIATVIVCLIVSAVALVHSNITIMNVSRANFERGATLYQIEEYLAVGDYQTASNYALDHGFFVDIESTSDGLGVNYLTITVSEQLVVRLYIEKRNGTTVKYIYGDGV